MTTPSKLDPNQILQAEHDEATDAQRVTDVGTAAASTAVITSVAGSASSVLLLAANSSRKGFTLYNNSTATAYVAFAATATTSAFTFKMAPNSLYEKDLVNYTGIISCIWDAVNGAMLVTGLS